MSTPVAFQFGVQGPPAAAIALDASQLRSLLVIASVVEARDPYTGGHLWRVSRYSRLLAQAAGLSAHEILLAAIGGFLHDVGKVGIPDRVLMKKKALTRRERAVIQTHPLVGRDMLTGHPVAPLALDAVLYHHERADGQGYPHGLNLGQTPLTARVVAVADSFDAMTSARPYHTAMPLETAMQQLVAERGRQFDGELAQRFLTLAEAGALDHVLGHSRSGQKLLNCPWCGPILALPKGIASGATIYCRACAAEFRLLADGEGFAVEYTGQHGSPAAIQPAPDMDAIEETEEALAEAA
jgi:HD-GYP domain-containing protein (c-di-GMP phosphodiesterase class II)